MPVKCILAQVQVLLAAAALFECDPVITIPEWVKFTDLEVEILQTDIRLVVQDDSLHTRLVYLREGEVVIRRSPKKEAPVHGTSLHRVNALVVDVLSELDRRAARSHTCNLSCPEVLALTFDVLG